MRVGRKPMRKKVIVLLFLCIIICVPFICLGQDSKPIAKFSFEKETFEQNEPVTAIEESYSPVGNKITKREWRCTIKGKQKTSASLTNLLSNAPLGKIEVFLRVRDDSGNWSDWVSQKITITKPVPIEITEFKSEQAVYAVGEKLQLTYTYKNPNDLEIKSQRWRYKNLSTNGNLISSKPKYFKKNGVYEVSLELQDEWGNWSNKVSCQVNVSNEVIERNEHYLFEKGKQGDLIDNYIDSDYNDFSAANVVSVVDIPGTLIMSNSPETVNESGILYRDTTTGIGRIIVHHVNNTPYAKKFMIVASNPSEQNVSLSISNNAIKGPSKHTLPLGQQAVSQYLTGTPTKSYDIKPGQMTCVYDSSKVKSWKKGEVVTGTLDFDSTGEVTWQIIMMDENSNVENISKLKTLDRDVHDRGTFNVIERQYVLDLNDASEPLKLVLGKEKEEWLQGIDAITGEASRDGGNYGVPIKIVIKNNEDMGVIANARGGYIQGALKWNKTKVFNIPDEGFLSSKTVAAYVGTVPANSANEIVYMLPNGSCAPILFGFIPKSLWK